MSQISNVGSPPRGLFAGFARRGTTIALGLLLALLCSGCLAVPVKAPRTRGPGGEVAKGEIDLGFLQEGVTRREEVVSQIRFSKKTPAGKRATLIADFPTFITLLRYANLSQIPVK